MEYYAREHKIIWYDKVSSDSPATYGALQMCFDLIWYPNIYGNCCGKYGIRTTVYAYTRHKVKCLLGRTRQGRCD